LSHLANARVTAALSSTLPVMPPARRPGARPTPNGSGRPAPARASGSSDGATRSREFVQSVERALEIIRAFGPDAPEQTVNEISVKVSLKRATTRRFLITLAELGYIDTDGRTFWLTPRVLELGYSFLSGLGLPDIALPHLERLVAEVDETSEASILDRDEIVYVVRVPSRAIMTVAINVGARMPAHATSMGKVLLASLEPAALRVYLRRAKLRPILPNTITDRRALQAELDRVRAQGYATVDQELEEGLVAIAVPIRTRSGHVAAAINLSTHIARRTVESLERELLGPLLRTAREIEHDLVTVSPGWRTGTPRPLQGRPEPQ
jgi:IclR family transcriptional regulator, pca regulon regulatory protein